MSVIGLVACAFSDDRLQSLITGLVGRIPVQGSARLILATLAVAAVTIALDRMARR